MGSIFYLVGLLNALYTIMWVVFVISVGVLVGILVSKAIDNDESWMDEKEKKFVKKSKKISSILCAISVLYILFAPSGDTYLKMKVADQPLVQDIIELVDAKVLQELEEGDFIDYD